MPAVSTLTAMICALAHAGNARVRRGMIQLAWRFLLFQKNNDLARWFQARTTDGRKTTRNTMIVALAQAADCAVAFRHRARGAAGHHRACGMMEHAGRGRTRHTPIGRARSRVCR